LASYPDAVFDALNDAQLAYERHGFRELEKIKAVEEKVERIYLGRGMGTVESRRTLTRYNIYIHGDRHDNTWTWKGIRYSIASRTKLSGSINIPYDHAGVTSMEIAHEVFHSIQARYYTMLGMSEIKLIGTTNPRAAFVNRMWWLEATAEYAAGKLVFPEADGSPNSAMGGDVDWKRLDKPLTYSPSGLWRGSEKPAYANAWFIEFLVSEKGLDFRELFESVASYHWPSVYDNLATYLKSKGLDLDQVFADYAVWWFLSPAGPVQRTVRTIKVPLEALTDASPGTADTVLDGKVLLKVPGKDLTDHFVFAAMAGQHRAMIKEIRESAPAGAGARSDAAALGQALSSPRPLIVVWENPDEFFASDTWLYVIKLSPGGSPPMTTRRIEAKEPVLIERLGADQSLYILAVRHDDHGDYNPRFRLTNAELMIEPAEIKDGSPTQRYTLTATANSVPEPLTPRVRFEWQNSADPDQSAVNFADRNVSETITASLADQQFEIGQHTVTVRLYADGDILLAEASARITIGSAPEPTPPTSASAPKAQPTEPPAEGGHWRLVQTLADPGSTQGEYRSHGTLCATTSASWSDGSVALSVNWPATPRNQFYSCENTRNMSFSGSVSWKVPTQLYPDKEMTYEAQATTENYDSIWPASIAWELFRGSRRISRVFTRSQAGTWTPQEPHFVVDAGNPQAGERGTRLELVVLVTLTRPFDPAGDFNPIGRYTYVYEWVP
jgi:hypothetical protein